MFYSELLRQRAGWLLEMGEETGGRNQGVSLHFEERGLVPAGALGWKAEKFWWDLLDFGGG